MKLLQHEQTGMYRIVGIYGSSGSFWTENEALKDYKRVTAEKVSRSACMDQKLGDKCICFSCEASRVKKQTEGK